MIDEPDKARRLAKAICADVALYEGERVRAAPRAERAGLLRRPLTEGRALYVSRVSPALHGLFDEEVGGLCQRLDSGPVTYDASIPMAAAHPPVERARPVGEDGGGAGLVIAIAVAVLVAVSALAGWLLLRS